MVDFQCKDFYSWQDFLEIMRLLRSPDGCPWDRRQTHQSIRRNFLEETYEVLDALDRDAPDALCEELGDVLMQVVFHADLERDAGRFTLDDVIDRACKKLVFRHPHVFGGTLQADTPQQVLVNWEELKRQEKGQRSTADALDGVAHTLPALWRAEKIASKADKAGFRWEAISGALDKLEEEVQELRRAVETGQDPHSPHGAEEELGDLLFIAAKVAQMTQIDPEEALQRACDKFNRRFRYVESHAASDLKDCTEAQLLSLWDEAKHQES